VVVLAGSLDGISPALAVLAGLVSFVSPCVLPLVPAYLAYLGARAGQPVAVTVVRSGVVAMRDSARLAPTGPYSAPTSAPLAPAVRFGSPSLPVVTAGLGFVAGLSLIFILFFYLFSFAVQPIRAYVPAVAGVIVIAFALHVAGLIRLPFLDREYRVMDRAPSRGGVAGGFVLGMGFASGWTPCIGVTLGAVLSSAVTTGTTSQGLVLMLAYCLGLGLPFVALAFALERARPLVRVINSHRRAIDLVSAGVLLVMGLLLLTNKLTILATGITQLVPSWPSGSL
jgi:cytochrome c-type biogenesis protein